MSLHSRPIDFLITGVSSGLGKAMAQELLDRNFSVTGICRQSPQALIHNKKFQFMKLDLSDSNAVSNFLLHFPNSQIPQHLILNAALTQNDTNGGVLNRNLFDKIMQINLYSNFSFLLHFSNQMQNQDRSSVVFINHMDYIRQFRNKGLAVNASKAALEAIMKSYRLNPNMKKINFLSVFPSRMEYDSVWPLIDSYQHSAQEIIFATFKRKETLYLPKWKFIFYELSRLIPEKYLRKILYLNFSNHSSLHLEKT